MDIKKIDYKSLDFNRYAYFWSKAKNYSVVVKPRVEEILATGERRVAKDDKGNEMVGLRIEFHNHEKRIAKTKENEEIIKFLREKVEKEKDMPEKHRQIIEITKPEKVYKKSEVKELLSEKEKEIEKLKKELEQKSAGRQVNRR